MCQPIPPVLIQVGILIERRVDSRFNRGEPVALVLSYFQRTRPKCKTEIFYSTGRQKKLTILVLMEFLRIPTLCWKQWVAFITFLSVTNYVFLPLKKISNSAVSKESSLTWDGDIYKKTSLSVKCAHVNGGDCTRHLLRFNTMSGKSFLQTFTDKLPTPRWNNGKLFGYVQCDIEGT